MVFYNEPKCGTMRKNADVAKRHGVDTPRFYADLAEVFLNDADARPGKLKNYYLAIPQKSTDA